MQANLLCKQICYASKSGMQANLFFIVWLLYVLLLRGKNRHGLVWAIMTNLPELPINDEARNEAHIASTGVRLY